MKPILKAAWVLAVLSFVAVYAHRRQEAMLEASRMLDWKLVFVALMLVLSAKLALIANMHMACTRFSIQLGWRDCFCIYNMTQLAKYLPGSIWQFVGRIAILLERGVPRASIRDALFAEHLWVILVACCVGATALALGGGAALAAQVVRRVRSDLPDSSMLVGVMAFGVIGIGMVTVWLRRRGDNSSRLVKWVRGLAPTPAAVSVLVLAWVLLGASLWITAAPFIDQGSTLLYVVGAYALAYVIGFIAPFAPAGLGVREGVIVLALTPIVNPEVGVLLAALNRVIYLVAELLLAALSIRGAGQKKAKPSA